MEPLHPAPVEAVRDWDEPANREQLRVPSDLTAPFMNAVRLYAEANNVDEYSALRILLESAAMVRLHPPDWLR
jgi:hypothetical protein